MVQYQYRQLGALAALGIPGLHLPRALALIVPKRTVVMEFVRGQTLRELARHGSADDLVAVSELSGQQVLPSPDHIIRTVGKKVN